ncbi:hypothetical protein BBP40_008935 [Aspergillus hancockii]|nr:hypothetical protein BBP40_008935 [Aspergillus hancockii]
MSESNRLPRRPDKLADFGQECQQPYGSRKRLKDDDNLSGTTLNHPLSSSAESSVLSLDSPSVEASSAGSSPILAGLGIPWGSNTATSTSASDIYLSEAAKDYPTPLVSSSLHRAPLPPVPPLAPSRACGGKERALPFEPLPYHLAALDKALERGLVHNISPITPEHPGNPKGHAALPGATRQACGSVEAADRACAKARQSQLSNWASVLRLSVGCYGACICHGHPIGNRCALTLIPLYEILLPGNQSQKFPRASHYRNPRLAQVRYLRPGQDGFVAGQLTV